MSAYIIRSGNPLNMHLYIDGGQAVEKENTTEARDQTRRKALERTEKSIDIFEERLNDNLRAGKGHFTDIKAELKSSVHWSLRSRQEFANHMRHRGWPIDICETEADLAMARDAQPDYVIILKDSDMMAYHRSRQFKLKFYRKPAQSNSDSIKKSKPKGGRVSSGHQKKPLTDFDKNGLVWSMNWHHPQSSLEIGTVRANVRRVRVKPADIDKDEEDAGGNKHNDGSDVANRKDKESGFYSLS
ncbi:hypothetical protein BG004_005941 [Podila humilis]|nr:hypothetical protein BG004_005941 [Podila humilis]